VKKGNENEMKENAKRKYRRNKKNKQKLKRRIKLERNGLEQGDVHVTSLRVEAGVNKP
jgi:hypothetical protein